MTSDYSTTTRLEEASTVSGAKTSKIYSSTERRPTLINSRGTEGTRSAGFTTGITQNPSSTMTNSNGEKIIETTTNSISFTTSDNTPKKPENIEKFDLFLDPDKEEERENQVRESVAAYDEKFGSLDMEKSYEPMFELLWYSQMPCIDIQGITSDQRDELSFIKRCYWKNRPISCNAIFQKRPTDRGMCCSFNMEKAENILKESKYAYAISSRQEDEKERGFEVSEVPEWYLDDNEPKAEAGRNKGLTLVVDRHSDIISASTVMDNFQGFVTVVDDNDKYPLTSSSSLIARPGYETNMEVKSTQVYAENEIRDFGPEKRDCYFPDELDLDMHQLYSQSNCLLECRVKYAYECMKTCMEFEQMCDCGNVTLMTDVLGEMKDSCTPWFYPVQNEKVGKMCNPWNMLKFVDILENDIPEEECDYCLPECTTTVYETSISYAQFQKCDHTNTGTNYLCDMVNGNLNPAPWTYLAQTEYANASPNDSLPWYLETDASKLKEIEGRMKKFPDQRRRVTEPSAEQSALFKSDLEKNPTYNAFEKDIGIVNIFFGKSYSTKYVKKNRMTGFDFLSQVGGAVGLAMGISIVSVVEIIYWFTIRLVRSYWS